MYVIEINILQSNSKVKFKIVSEMNLKLNLLNNLRHMQILT